MSSNRVGYRVNPSLDIKTAQIMTIPLYLSNNVKIRDAVSLVRKKFTAFKWDWYDGVTSNPDMIEPIDFAITVAMNSRATAGRMIEFMLLAEKIGECLCQVSST